MFKQSTPTKKAFMQTQLHFNIEGDRGPTNGSNYQKPRPIIIEKLLPYPSNDYLKSEESMHHLDTHVSSEKLATAMQLAKMDIKRLKTMLHTSLKDSSPLKDERRSKSRIRVKETSNDNIITKEPSKAAKVIKRYETRTNPEINRQRARNAPNSPSKEDGEVRVHPDEKQLKELKQLRTELEKHTKSLQEVVRDIAIRHSASSATNLVSREEVDEKRKKVQRAEGHVTRSAQLLYGLQRKINELQNHLNKKTQPRHTKKSAYLQSVSAAHRAAVRTLRTFATHAPLYYDTSGHLPHMYTELGHLIQQLTQFTLDAPTNHITAHQSIVKDLVLSLRELESRNHSTSKSKSDGNRVALNQKRSPSINKKEFLDSHNKWIKQKADDLNMKLQEHQDEPTPERMRTLQHAQQTIDGFLNAEKWKKNQGSSKEPSVGRLKRNKMRLNDRRKPKPKSSWDTRRRLSTFAEPTVASRIREKPPVQGKVIPPSTPKKNVAFDVDFRMPKERDEEIVLKAKLGHRANSLSPPRTTRSQNTKSTNRKSRLSYTETSPPNQRNPSPTSYHNEKEIKREHWLERVKSRELRRLNLMSKVNNKEFSQLRKDFELSKHLVAQAEREICDRLKPLLDKAELIAHEDEKRAEEYKVSVKKRLADVASQQALSEGERLAEYILDDLLMEAAIDLSQIDRQSDAELEAAFQYDRPTLESIEERLQSFEREEEAIRRNQKSIGYTETRLSQPDRSLGRNLEDLETSGNPASIIRFTKSRPKFKVQEHGDPVIPRDNSKWILDVPKGMFDNIMSRKLKFEEHAKKNVTDSFNPWELVTSVSEEVLNGVIAQVALELNETCNQFVDDVYEKEFVQSNQ